MEQTEIFWSLIGVFCAGAAFIGAFWAANSRGADTPGSPAAVKNLVKTFHNRVAHFTLQVRVLDEHANEYTSIFNSADWNTLVETVSKLEQADLKAHDLIREKRFKEAANLLAEMHNKGGGEFDQIQASLDSYTASANWETHVHGMLKRVVQNLEAATLETREITKTVTSRRRQPTLVTLADVKKTLLEDEVLTRGVARSLRGEVN
jgi:hypothetical protein